MGNTKQTLTTPMAIVAAGFLIMIGLLATGGINGGVKKEKTLSEQVGVKKEALDKCLSEVKMEDFANKLFTSVESATKGEDGVGTPYSVVVGKNGVKTKISGAASYENVKKVIDEVIAGTVTVPYTGELPPLTTEDHVLGNVETAQVTIIEYSDFECPYCKNYNTTLNKIISESNGNIAWVYRHFPLVQIHANALEKAAAADCVAQLKGNDAFWKYKDLLFNMLKTESDPITSQL